MKKFPWKPAVFLLCLVPLALLAWDAFAGTLGANPIEKVTRSLGDWALRFLLLSLAVTPARQVFGWPWVMRFRRMIGLYAFFYAALHVLSYFGLDLFFDLAAFVKDVVKRKYITVGMVTMVLLAPLAATSTNAMIKRLGGARWRALHRLVYPSAMLAVLHYYMMVKADIREPLIYGAVLSLLLGWRLAKGWMRQMVRTA